MRYAQHHQHMLRTRTHSFRFSYSEYCGHMVSSAARSPAEEGLGTRFGSLVVPFKQNEGPGAKGQPVWTRNLQRSNATWATIGRWTTGWAILMTSLNNKNTPHPCPLFSQREPSLPAKFLIDLSLGSFAGEPGANAAPFHPHRTIFVQIKYVGKSPCYRIL